MNSENPYETPKFGKIFSEDAPLPFPEKQPLMRILFSFEGRVPRRIDWGVSLCIAVVFYTVLFGIEIVFGQDTAALLILLLMIPLLWISFAVQAKRWHDRDKSGWWILIGFVPLIGPLWAFIEAGCLRGSFGSNRYGPDPT